MCACDLKSKLINIFVSANRGAAKSYRNLLNKKNTLVKLFPLSGVIAPRNASTALDIAYQSLS